MMEEMASEVQTFTPVWHKRVQKRDTSYGLKLKIMLPFQTKPMSFLSPFFSQICVKLAQNWPIIDVNLNERGQ